MNKAKFTIKDFNEKYVSDDVCLQEIFENRFGNLKTCPECKTTTKFHKVSNRKCYACQNCGYQLHPLAGTIFHKSSTSLKNWFYALYLFANSKNGVSAKELERQLGVTYKCAWRMAKQIRLLFEQNKSLLSDIVEADETYIGGKSKGKRGRGAENKTSVVGLVQRQGEVKARVTVNTKSITVKPLIRENVAIQSHIMTDEYRSYNNLDKYGYQHSRINHVSNQYVNGDVHTNTIEGFWSQLKRSINGTYHAVSPKYLQDYVNEFAWRYNLRSSDLPIFHLMVVEAGMPA